MPLINEKNENNLECEIIAGMSDDLDLNDVNTTEYIPAEEESKDLIQVFKLKVIIMNIL
jgi:hypothetical protein